jgi:hypothetical protein
MCNVGGITVEGEPHILPRSVSTSLESSIPTTHLDMIIVEGLVDGSIHSMPSSICHNWIGDIGKNMP